MRCRSCKSDTLVEVLDLGEMPNANAFITPDQGTEAEQRLPLSVCVCTMCWLMQVNDTKQPAYFFNQDYPYFSSWSSTWLDHARRFCMEIMDEGALPLDGLVVEIASNDGYLLRNFVDAGVRVFGVDPAANCAEAARSNHGIETVVDFFGYRLANELVAQRGRADLIVANNVLAHVPDPNDFVAGVKVLLADAGLATFEFAHLVALLKQCQFDTIYHEHYSYLSFASVEALLERHGLKVTGVRQLPTHGGSLRVYTHHANCPKPIRESVARVRRRENEAGLRDLKVYEGFRTHAEEIKHGLRRLLTGLRKQDSRIAGYGAPAKGNTLLNYCGIGRDLVEFTVDRNPWKQNKLLPGSHIPVRAPEVIADFRPDYLVILPWNLKEEIMEEMACIRGWGGRFIVPVPRPEILC